jgi:putative solute:sodium symporter small subunit
MHPESLSIADRQHLYWRNNLRLIGVLAAIWFLVTFGVSYCAGALAPIVFFGWPLPFYVAAQGALIVYVLIVWYYAKAMNDLDDEFERDIEGDEK